MPFFALSDPLVARLEACRVDDTSANGYNQRLYRVTKVIEAIEGITSTKASTRWTSLKCVMDQSQIVKHKGIVCVPDEHLDKLLVLLKESTEKTQVLVARGHLVDDTKVREVVLHAGNEHMCIEVSLLQRFRWILYRSLEILTSSESNKCCIRSTI
jgi:copper chaperone CopZ